LQHVLPRLLEQPEDLLGVCGCDELWVGQTQKPPTNDAVLEVAIDGLARFALFILAL
jgi:hypothetical protein